MKWPYTYNRNGRQIRGELEGPENIQDARKVIRRAYPDKRIRLEQPRGRENGQRKGMSTE